MKSLLPHQVTGVRELDAFDGIALLADEMGLGKTVTTLSWLRWRRSKALPALIVCPANAKWVWQDEARTWLGVPTAIVEGNFSAKSVIPSAPVWIINYDILPSWANYLRKREFKTVIADEIHYVKNSNGKRYHALRKTLGRFVGRKRDVWIPISPYRIALSGTPATNRPLELWPILFLLLPTLFPSRLKFLRRFCNPRWVEWGGGKMVYDGAVHLDVLHRLLSEQCMIRRYKKDHLKNLPPKQRKVVPVEILSALRREYNFAADNFLLWLSRNHPDHLDAAKRSLPLTKLGYLLRLTSRGKLPAAVRWIEDFLEESAGKLAVFSFHRPMLNSLSHYFGPKLLMTIDGSVTGKVRHQAVHRFQHDKRCRLALLQGKAAGVALTLTAAADVLVLDYPWSPGDLLQMEDRVHRIGQTRPVTIYCLVARGTVEEKVVHVLGQKQQILERLFDGGTGVTSEDLARLESGFASEVLGV